MIWWNNMFASSSISFILITVFSFGYYLFSWLIIIIKILDLKDDIFRINEENNKR